MGKPGMSEVVTMESGEEHKGGGSKARPGTGTSSNGEGASHTEEEESQQERVPSVRSPSSGVRSTGACRKRYRLGGLYSGGGRCNGNFVNSTSSSGQGFFTSTRPSSARYPPVPRSRKGPLLPPLSAADRESKTKTLVLDLDETLVHSSFKPIPYFDFTVQVEMEVEPQKMELQTVFVLKRPGVDEFLRAMAALFEVVVFTAGLKQYADAVLDSIDKEGCIKHRLYRESCRFHLGGLVKDLSTLGRDLRKVIIVDNSPHCYLLQPRNAVPIVSFIDNRDDHELLDLIPFLSVIAELENVTEALGQIT